MGGYELQPPAPAQVDSLDLVFLINYIKNEIIVLIKMEIVKDSWDLLDLH